MNLYLFPEAACKHDGYGIGVAHDYLRYSPKEDDIIVWYSSYSPSQIIYLRPSDTVISRFGLLTYRSIKNILCGKIRSELSIKDLSFLKDYPIDNIYCDDVLFYRTIRKLFPKKHIYVRFHNCFSRIYIRNLFLKHNVGLKYSITLKNETKLENEIFNDRNVYKIFITDEDRDFYRSMYGIVSDSETWSLVPELSLINSNRRKICFSNKLVWFGGIESHKECSVLWFINEVLPKIKKKVPSVEFHLWGKNTEKFANESSAVYGHGFYQGNGLPMEDCLYLNPDITGGGIKLKLITLLENGAPFISTPFGFEGYSKELVDGEYCHVVEEDNWVETIIDLLEKYRKE